MRADAVVQTRIPTGVKLRAASALGGMGLTISDAVRLMLTRVANEGRLPFELAPNPVTMAAIQELEEGKGHRVESVAKLVDDLMREIDEEE